MLVLTRKKGECVILSDPFTGAVLCRITICDVRGGNGGAAGVRIGFEAEKDTLDIYRPEVGPRLPAAALPE